MATVVVVGSTGDRQFCQALCSATPEPSVPSGNKARYHTEQSRVDAFPASHYRKTGLLILVEVSFARPQSLPRSLSHVRRNTNYGVIHVNIFARTHRHKQQQ